MEPNAQPILAHIKKIKSKILMINNDQYIKKSGNKQKENIGYNFILITILLLILFFESIYIIISIIKKGIFKKEILTRKSNIGFDISIRN